MLPTIIITSVLALCMAPPVDPDEGSVGSIRLKIPEPMVFDLVRPLGAAKGELEVNSLFRQRLTGAHRSLLWAPEIEVTFAEGHAIEFELPAEGSSLESYKLALQSKLPARKSRFFTHGWQGIVEKGRHGVAWETSQLYLTGVRWHPRWSSMSLHGPRYVRPRGARGEWQMLANNTLFYQAPRRPVVGFETNLRAARASGVAALLMPQVHFHLGQRVQLQVGLGAQREPADRLRPAAGWRLIREF